MLKWAIPVLVVLLAASAWMWQSWLASNADPNYDEDPTLWAGAGGSTGGLQGPLVLPSLAPQSRHDLSAVAAVGELPGRSLSAVLADFGPPDVRQDGERVSLLIWYSWLRLDPPGADGCPVAHLKVLAQDGEGDARIVCRVDAYGTLGWVVASTHSEAK